MLEKSILTPPGISRLPFILGALWALALVLAGQAAANTQGLLLTSLGISLLDPSSFRGRTKGDRVLIFTAAPLASADSG